MNSKDLASRQLSASLPTRMAHFVQMRLIPWFFYLTDRCIAAVVYLPGRILNIIRDRPVRFLFYIIVVSLFLLAMYAAFVFFHYFNDRDRIERSLHNFRESLYGRGDRAARPPVEIYSSDKILIGVYLPERGSRITMKSCSEMNWLRRAAVAAEDRDFYGHSGISLRGILRAAWRNVSSFSIREGGGTITQQLARNLFTDHAQTLYRKLYETYGAFQIESRLTKDEILCLYLNEIYMGEGRYGSEEASWYYFRKPPAALTALEAAMIVGLFPSPMKYSPLTNIHLSLKKQDAVAEAMAREGWLDVKEIVIQKKTFLERWRVNLETGDAGEIGAYGASRDFQMNAAPSANEYVRQFLYEHFPEDLIRKGGLKILTTIDSKKQTVVLESLRADILRIRREMKSQIQRSSVIPREAPQKINGTFIVLDPATGDVRAISGGYEVTEGGSMISRIWTQRRSTGEALRGFLFASVLDEDPRRELHSAVEAAGQISPERIRDRLAESLELNIQEARVRFPLTNLAPARGYPELTPMELMRLYSPMLNAGGAVPPRIVLRVSDRQGRSIWHAPNPEEKEMFFSGSCAGAIELMSGRLNDEWIGQAKSLNPRYLPFPLSGISSSVGMDTETAAKYPGVRGIQDAWFIAIVPGEISLVWIGQDDGIPFPGSSRKAAEIWAAYAQKILNGKVTEEFPKREDLMEQ